MGPDHPQLEIFNESKHGIAYRAKPVLRNATSCHIDATDLTSALYFMGLA